MIHLRKIPLRIILYSHIALQRKPKATIIFNNARQVLLIAWRSQQIKTLIVERHAINN